MVINFRTRTVGNITRGNNQFVVTLENFIFTRGGEWEHGRGLLNITLTNEG